MENSQKEYDDTAVVYQAIVGYLTALVQMRFSAASLYCAAAAFLIAAVFSETEWLDSSRLLVSYLGLVVTSMIWLMELRTHALIKNFAALGETHEKQLLLPTNAEGFFARHQAQPIGIAVPFSQLFTAGSHGAAVRAGSPLAAHLLSHTFALNMMYFSFFLFWFYMTSFATIQVYYESSYFGPELRTSEQAESGIHDSGGRIQSLTAPANR